jgi:hypothetical protein
MRYLYRKTKTEAKKALREALRDRDDNIVPPSRMTLCNLLDERMDERRETISRRTWINQESIVRCRVKPHIGSERRCKQSVKDEQLFTAGCLQKDSQPLPSDKSTSYSNKPCGTPCTRSTYAPILLTT